jgi:hypothetical protein
MPISGEPIYSIAYGNDVFLLLGGGLARLESGKEWEILRMDCDMPWLTLTRVDGHSMIYDGTRFIIAGNEGIYFTENGDNFEQVSTKSWWRWHAEDKKVSIAYNNSVYVTVYGTEIGTLNEGYVSVINPKQGAKLLPSFTLRQDGRTLKIIMPNKNTHPQVDIFNLAGKRQKVKPVFQANGVVSLSVSHLAPGLYVLSVDGKKGDWQRKIIVK